MINGKAAHAELARHYANPDVEAEILAEQVRLLYEQLVPGLLSAAIDATLCGVALWTQVPTTALLTWLLAIGSVTTGRFALACRYRQRRPQTDEAPLWARRFVIGAFLGGCMWGSLGSVLFPVTSYPHQAFVAFVLAGIVGGALSSMSAYPVAYRAFLVPSVVPYLLRLLANGDSVSWMMSIIALLYLVHMYLMSNSYHRMLLNSLWLRYDNHSLKKNLQNKAEIEALLNEELEEQISVRRRTQAALQTSADCYRTLVETTGIGYCVLDAQGLILDANANFIGMTGNHELAQIRGKHLTTWTATEDRVRYVSEMEKCLAIGAIRNLELEYQRGGTERIPIEINATLVRAEAGVRMLGLVRDITERKEAENALRKAHALLEVKVQQRTAALAQEKERFRVTLASIADAVITTDSAAKITYLNPVAETLTGWSNERAQGLKLAEVFGGLNDDNAPETIDVITACITHGLTIGPGHHWHLVRQDGAVLSIDMAVAPILERAEQIVGAVITFQDVTKQRALAQQLVHQATHDSLTGLVNRFEFERRLEQVRASAHPSRPHAMLYLDLDRFKVVNDSCGHGAGDDLLRQLAVILQSNLRARDTLARLGGDEFGVILEHCPTVEAARIATDLCKQVHDFRFSCSGSSFSLGVSIGLVSIANKEESLSRLMGAADRACFAAKEEGRNRVHVHESGDAGPARRKGRTRWLARIRTAIDEQRLCLYLQPAVAVSTAATSAYQEILLRMVDEQGALVPPGAFLPAAERYEQMGAIDRWVVSRSLALLAAGADRQEPQVYGINLSGQSIADTKFSDFVLAKMTESAIDPRQLCFEITESAALTDLSHVLRFMDKLKAHGCRFALDDFGAGMSSFSYLKTLPVDYLKIDGRFVRGMTANPTDHALVEAIHRIGHVMGLQTIAEWVEDEVTLRDLQQIGVDYVQGYRVGTPQPLTS